jgi:hypothetical protein
LFPKVSSSSPYTDSAVDVAFGEKRPIGFEAIEFLRWP